MNPEDMVVGKYYMIKCGWGLTKAKLESIYKTTDGKTKYDWITSRGFQFCSYDVEDTKEIKQSGRH